MELATAEVERLNALHTDKDDGVRYWFQYTRLFHDGESAGTIQS